MTEKETIIELKKSLKNKLLTFDEMLNYIDKLSENDPNLAEKLLNEIKKKTKQSNNTFVRYLSNKIKDKKRERKMPPEQKHEIEEYINLGRNALKEEDYEKAYEIFRNAYEATKQPIFKYYLGKTCYYKRNLSLAATHLNDYINVSSENYSKANLYLWVIAKRTHKPQRRDYRIAILYYLPKVFESERSYDDLLSEITEIPNADLVFPSNALLSKKITASKIPEKNENKSQPIISHEREPKLVKLETEEEKYADFYSFSFEEQMNIIRECYQAGNIFIADQLLKKAETAASGNKKREKAIKQEKSQRHVYVKKANQN